MLTTAREWLAEFSDEFERQKEELLGLFSFARVKDEGEYDLIRRNIDALRPHLETIAEQGGDASFAIAMPEEALTLTERLNRIRFSEQGIRIHGMARSVQKHPKTKTPNRPYLLTNLLTHTRMSELRHDRLCTAAEGLLAALLVPNLLSNEPLYLFGSLYDAHDMLRPAMWRGRNGELVFGYGPRGMGLLTGRILTCEERLAQRD